MTISSINIGGKEYVVKQPYNLEAYLNKNCKKESDPESKFVKETLGALAVITIAIGVGAAITWWVSREQLSEIKSFL